MVKKADVKHYLTTQKLTPLHIIYVVAAIFYFIFTETETYESIPDFVQTIMFIAIIVGGVLLGVSFLNIKKLAQDMKSIYLNKNMTALEKVNAYGNLAVKVLSLFGEAFDLLNQEQFEKKDEIPSL